MSEETSPPVAEFKLGAVKALVWRNQTQYGVRHNVTVQRLYKDGDDWKSTQTFGRDDLPLLAKVADRAFEWIFENAAPVPS